MSKLHIPVMLDEVMENLAPESGQTYIDCTFGAGGYSRKILSSCNCKLYAIDQDPNVKAMAETLKKEYPKSFSFISNNFSKIFEIANEHDIANVDGIVFDLGVSSMQLDDAERGFSFNKEAKLDMRMSQEGMSAWDVVNKYSEENLADIIYYYGEERGARRIAANIVKARKLKTIDTTIELAQIVRSSVKQQGKADAATKTFQAIRVYVNDELKTLRIALSEAYALLKVGGKLVVVSFQGLEDRVIKDLFKKEQNLKLKMVKPSREEILKNPRSRSAKLRVLIKSNEEGGKC
jgi:16S rRNA (cytosine1402-N4)-methyltransferase